MNSQMQSCIDHIKSAVDVDPWAVELVEKVFKNCIHISDNATNGDVIMTLFPNEYDFETDFDEEWWNAPYKTESDPQKSEENES